MLLRRHKINAAKQSEEVTADNVRQEAVYGDELKYVTEAYETNWMSTVGTNINEIERTVAEKIGCKYAVALSCGTAALHLCIKLAGIKPGDAVLINFVC